MDLEMRIGNNPKCKHFNSDINYLREVVAKGLIMFIHVFSEDNIADALTKPLPEETCNRLNIKLMHGIDAESEVVDTGTENITPE